MSEGVIELARGSAKVGVILLSIALGLCAAVLAVWAAKYYGHAVGAPHTPYDDSADSVSPMYVLFFGACGLIWGLLVGVDAAEQLWPYDAEAEPMTTRIMRVVRRGSQIAIVILSIAFGLFVAGLVARVLNPSWMLLLIPTGLIGGAVLGWGAAAQLWPPADEGAN